MSKPLNSVYVSYSWEVEEQTKIVERLESACRARDIKLIRDVDEISYPDSIRKYMKELGAGDFIIVVFSDHYLKSKYCMYELLEIEQNRQFIKRVFPVVLKDARISEPSDRIDYIRYWEDKINALKVKLKDVDPTNLTTIQRDLNLYADIRRSIDVLMDTIGDMNTLSKDTHLQTGFDALLSKIDSRIKHINARIEIRKAVQSNIAEHLHHPPLKALKEALIGELERVRCFQAGHDAVQSLCEIDDVEKAIYPVLHSATRNCLEKARYEVNARDRISEAAVEILGWLVLLSVNDEWVFENRNCFKGEGSRDRFEIPLKTEAGIVIVVSRLDEKPAIFKFDPNGTEVYGRYRMDDLQPEMGPGTHNRVLGIKQAIWRVLFKNQPPQTFEPDDNEELNLTLETRRNDRENYYIAVPSSEPEHHLNDEKVYRELLKDLPSLTAVFVGSGQGDVLLIPERRLQVRIREFLRMVQKYTDEQSALSH